MKYLIVFKNGNSRILNAKTFKTNGDYIAFYNENGEACLVLNRDVVFSFELMTEIF